MEVQVRDIMAVQSFLQILLLRGGSLMDAHGIREGAREQVVVADGNLGDDVRQTQLLGRAKVE